MKVCSKNKARGRAAAARYRALLFCSAGFLLLGGLFWAFTGTSLCEIRRISIHGVKYGIPEDLLLESGIQRGVNIFSDLGAFELALRGHPLIKEAHFERKPPQALSIHVEEREPFVLLKTKRPIPMSLDGVIIPEERIGVDLDLPLLTIEGALGNFKNSVNAGLSFLSDLRDQAPYLLPLVSELVVRDGEPAAMYLRFPRARVLIGSRFTRISCGLLVGVIKTLGKEEGFFEIDLRFPNQAVLRMIGEEEPSKPRAI
jgi:cell division septal protein FtsQ